MTAETAAKASAAAPRPSAPPRRTITHANASANATWADTCAAADAATAGPSAPSDTTMIAIENGIAAIAPPAAGPRRRSTQEARNISVGAASSGARTMALHPGRPNASLPANVSHGNPCENSNDRTVDHVAARSHPGSGVDERTPNSAHSSGRETSTRTPPAVRPTATSWFSPARSGTAAVRASRSHPIVSERGSTSPRRHATRPSTRRSTGTGDGQRARAARGAERLQVLT